MNGTEQYTLQNLLQGQSSVITMLKGGDMMMFDGIVNFGAMPMMEMAQVQRAAPPMAPNAGFPAEPMKSVVVNTPTSSTQDSKNVKTEDSKYDTKERVDFAQTVLFTQFLNVTNGRLTGSFKLSELITKFRF